MSITALISVFSLYFIYSLNPSLFYLFLFPHTFETYATHICFLPVSSKTRNSASSRSQLALNHSPDCCAYSALHSRWVHQSAACCCVEFVVQSLSAVQRAYPVYCGNGIRYAIASVYNAVGVNSLRWHTTCGKLSIRRQKQRSYFVTRK